MLKFSIYFFFRFEILANITIYFLFRFHNYILFDILDSLDDEWYVWLSVRWDKDSEMLSGEADCLLFKSKSYLICFTCEVV